MILNEFMNLPDYGFGGTTMHDLDGMAICDSAIYGFWDGAILYSVMMRFYDFAMIL